MKSRWNWGREHRREINRYHFSKIVTQGKPLCSSSPLLAQALSSSFQPAGLLQSLCPSKPAQTEPCPLPRGAALSNRAGARRENSLKLSQFPRYVLVSSVCTLTRAGWRANSTGCRLQDGGGSGPCRAHTSGAADAPAWKSAAAQV